MTRFVLASALALLLGSFTSRLTAAQAAAAEAPDGNGPTVLLRASLTGLNLGPIFNVIPVELDGRPGSEFLLKTDAPFGTEWTVVYPNAPGGLCVAGTIDRQAYDQIVDIDGDGRQEILRFDPQRQTVTVFAVPRCPR